jgi:hypothetical protein
VTCYFQKLRGVEWGGKLITNSDLVFGTRQFKLFQGTLPTCVWREWGNTRRSSVRRTDFCVSAGWGHPNINFQVDFWVVTPCSDVLGYQRSTGPCCLLTPYRNTTRRHPPWQPQKSYQTETQTRRSAVFSLANFASGLWHHSFLFQILNWFSQNFVRNSCH